MIDTHCHLNSAEHFPDPGAEIEAARAAGVEVLMVVGIDLEGSRRAIEIAEEHDGVYAIVGHHPNYAHTYEPALLHEYRAMLAHPRVVALGEIGLDYHWDFATKEQQFGCLTGQLKLAEELAVPVVFHCREAYGDLLDLLERQNPHPSPPVGGRAYLFHCFAGTPEDAGRALALGAYFGVDGPITYKNAHALRETIKSIPRDRIVLETDSPYMAPVPHRGKPNRPAYLPLINAALAHLWGVSKEAAAHQTTQNAKRFFGIG